MGFWVNGERPTGESPGERKPTLINLGEAQWLLQTQISLT